MEGDEKKKFMEGEVKGDRLDIKKIRRKLRNDKFILMKKFMRDKKEKLVIYSEKNMKLGIENEEKSRWGNEKEFGKIVERRKLMRRKGIKMREEEGRYVVIVKVKDKDIGGRLKKEILKWKIDENNRKGKIGRGKEK